MILLVRVGRVTRATGALSLALTGTIWISGMGASIAGCIFQGSSPSSRRRWANSSARCSASSFVVLPVLLVDVQLVVEPVQLVVEPVQLVVELLLVLFTLCFVGTQLPSASYQRNHRNAPRYSPRHTSLFPNQASRSFANNSIA